MDLKLFFLLYRLNEIKKVKELVVLIMRAAFYFYVLFFAIIGYYFYTTSLHYLYKYLFICALNITIVTIIRKLINSKRPFEVLNIAPLIFHTRGESFPSRHTASTFIISLFALEANIYIGIILCILSGVVSLCRIISGIHYPKDILGAFIITCFIYFITK